MVQRGFFYQSLFRNLITILGQNLNPRLYLLTIKPPEDSYYFCNGGDTCKPDQMRNKMKIHSEYHCL